MSISMLELRHIIESGFLPMACRCTSNASSELTVEVIDPLTGDNMVVGRISIGSLSTSRAISELIGQLRKELHSPERSHRQQRTKLS